MSSMDYLCCKKCDGKIFYDAHDDLLDRLDDYFEGKGLLCPDCVEKVETELAEARAEIERLNGVLDDWNWIDEHKRELDIANKAISERDKLIEQMRKALNDADDLIDEYAADYEHRDNVDEIRDEIKAALSAAERR